MSEQVVVICSIDDGRSAIDLCTRLEEQGLTCWTPVREEDPDAARWSLPSKIRSARAMVVVTSDIGEHSDAVERAAENRIPVVIASPDGDGRWLGVMRELADALGLSAEWLVPRGTSPGSVPKTHIADDETEFLEFIAEHVSEAQVFVRFGLFEKAVDHLKKVFVKAPRNLEAYDQLLKIYLETEEWKKAAGAAADFLECLRYRGDSESFAILRAHLEARGFTADEGPPVAVGYADVDPVPTKFFDAAPKAAAATAAPQMSGHPTVPTVPTAPVGEPPPALELPALRNFSSAQAALRTSGVEAELSGIDFFVDHGMLDEARARIDQLFHEHPDHPGVIERRDRIVSLGAGGGRTAIMLELEDPWEAASKMSAETSGSTQFASETVAAAEPAPSLANGPIGDGDPLICTLFLPAAVEPGDMFVVRACVHKPGQGGHPMLDVPHDRRESNMLARKLRPGKALALALDLPGLELDQASFTIAWSGEPDSVEFGVVVPFIQPAGIVGGVLSLRTEDGSAGEFSITISVS